jgi:hypothetical protein
VEHKGYKVCIPRLLEYQVGLVGLQAHHRSLVMVQEAVVRLLAHLQM